MIPLLLEIEFPDRIKANAFVVAIGWLDLEKSLTITLTGSSLSPGPLSLIIRADGEGDYLGELVDGNNDRVAVVTNIIGVPQPDKLLSQAIDRFCESEAIAPAAPSIPPIPAYASRGAV